jgi:hypothetical protein
MFAFLVTNVSLATQSPGEILFRWPVETSTPPNVAPETDFRP